MTDPADDILTVEHVYKRFGGIYAVNGAGFSVRQGSWRAVYRIDGNRDVIVIEAGPRGSVYR